VTGNVFDQNRAAFGGGVRFSRDWRAAMGFLPPTLPKSNGKDLEQNPTLTLGLYYSLGVEEKDVRARCAGNVGVSRHDTDLSHAFFAARACSIALATVARSSLVACSKSRSSCLICCCCAAVRVSPAPLHALGECDRSQASCAGVSTASMSRRSLAWAASSRP